MARAKKITKQALPRAKVRMTTDPAVAADWIASDMQAAAGKRKKKAAPTPQAARGSVQHVRVVVRKDGSEEITVFGPAPAAPGLGGAPVVTSAGGVDSSGRLGGGGLGT